MTRNDKIDIMTDIMGYQSLARNKILEGLSVSSRIQRISLSSGSSVQHCLISCSTVENFLNASASDKPFCFFPTPHSASLSSFFAMDKKKVLSLYHQNLESKRVKTFRFIFLLILG